MCSPGLCLGPDGSVGLSLGRGTTLWRAGLAPIAVPGVDVLAVRRDGLLHRAGTDLIYHPLEASGPGPALRIGVDLSPMGSVQALLLEDLAIWSQRPSRRSRDASPGAVVAASLATGARTLLVDTHWSLDGVHQRWLFAHTPHAIHLLHLDHHHRYTVEIPFGRVIHASPQGVLVSCGRGLVSWDPVTDQRHHGVVPGREGDPSPPRDPLQVWAPTPHRRLLSTVHGDGPERDHYLIDLALPPRGLSPGEQGAADTIEAILWRAGPPEALVEALERYALLQHSPHDTSFLRRLLDAPDRSVRAKALELLASSSDPSAPVVLLEALRRSHTPELARALIQVARLEHAAELLEVAPSGGVAAAGLLGWLGDRAGLPLLEERLQGPPPGGATTERALRLAIRQIEERALLRELLCELRGSSP